PHLFPRTPSRTAMADASLHPMFIAAGSASAAVPISFVTRTSWPDLRQTLAPGARAYADAAGFEPGPGRHLLLPGKGGALGGVLFGIEAEDAAARDAFRPGSLVN